MCSLLALLGEMFPIITVLQFPTRLSFKTRVNLLPLNGVWFLFRSNALMHSLSANNDLFISAPSTLVVLSWSLTSAPLSLPAKSMKDSFPWIYLLFLRVICRMAWDLDDSELAELDDVILELYPYYMICINYWTLLIFFSLSPLIWTFPLASSWAANWDLSLSKSNSLPQ